MNWIRRDACHQESTCGRFRVVRYGEPPDAQYWAFDISRKPTRELARNLKTAAEAEAQCRQTVVGKAA